MYFKLKASSLCRPKNPTEKQYKHLMTIWRKINKELQKVDKKRNHMVNRMTKIENLIYKHQQVY